MKIDFLTIEVELLLLKYGDAAIIKALAEAQGITADQVLQRLDAARTQKRQSGAKAKPRKAAIEIVKEVILGAENERELMDLAIRFQNKRFLPELKDVKRFSERNGIPSNFSSRDAAAKPIFEKLRLLGRERLDDLLGSSESNDESQFARLSRQLIEGEGEKDL